MNRPIYLALAALLLAPNAALADIQWVNFSFQFGASTLDVDGTTARGAGWSATSELYLDQKQGLLFNLGSSSVEAEDFRMGGEEVELLEVSNRYLQPGYFYYPLRGLRLGAGLSVNWLEESFKFKDKEEQENSKTLAGPFASVGYRLPLETLVLGAQYNYVKFGRYEQTDLFLLLGVAF